MKDVWLMSLAPGVRRMSFPYCHLLSPGHTRNALQVYSLVSQPPCPPSPPPPSQTLFSGLFLLLIPSNLTVTPGQRLSPLPGQTPACGVTPLFHLRPSPPRLSLWRSDPESDILPRAVARFCFQDYLFSFFPLHRAAPRAPRQFHLFGPCLRSCSLASATRTESTPRLASRGWSGAPGPRGSRLGAAPAPWPPRRGGRASAGRAGGRGGGGGGTGGPGACPRRGDRRGSAAAAAGGPGQSRRRRRHRSRAAGPRRRDTEEPGRPRRAGPPPPLGWPAPRCSRWRARGGCCCCCPRSAASRAPRGRRGGGEARGPGGAGSRGGGALRPGRWGSARRAGLRARGFRAGRGGTGAGGAEVARRGSTPGVRLETRAGAREGPRRPAGPEPLQHRGQGQRAGAEREESGLLWRRWGVWPA